ncbi:MAG TPA: class I SAM-dependent methyltransferase [Candidatus Eisenbacteria bacterium]|nr:class I SAM-dependent methyltransferase [Candidatus Eisenbacteria bacterium]
MERGRPPGDAYVLPRDAREIDRLDVQHFAAKAAHAGRNYLAPIAEPARILDVGCGTGQWAFELCAEFPPALVVGLDLVPSKPRPPGNYRFVRGNVLQGLPFLSETFDFVHQRLMVSGIPLKMWPATVRDLVRVTRPGGWLELSEAMPYVEPEGPATRRLWDLLRQLGRSVGLDTMGHVAGGLGRYLEGAGAESVQVHTHRLPIGDWGGQVGAWMASDVRSLFMRMIPAFTPSGVDEGTCLELIGAMLAEFEGLRSTIGGRIAFGRRGPA